MPEALARSHNDSILTGPARKSPRKARESFARSILRPLLSRPARTIAGATLAAVLTGIVVNALVLQKERHSAPFFAPAKPAAATTATSAAGATAGAESAPVVAQPPVRPAHLSAAVDPLPPPTPPTPPVRSGDPIRDLLRADSGKDGGRLTLAAQTALIKLGYVLKADGVEGATTTQAIEQFERAHHLTPSGEITAKLVKQLNEAAR